MNNTYYQRPDKSGKRTNNRYSEPQGMNQQQYSEYYQPNYQAPRYDNGDRAAAKPYSATKEMIANIILIVLSALFVLATLQVGIEIADIDNYYENNPSSFWWEYESGRYSGSVKERYENEYNGVEMTEELAQCYAVSEYFEAASLYKTAVHTGKTDKAAEYKATMEDAYSRMGDVSYLAEDINEKLGIADFAE